MNGAELAAGILDRRFELCVWRRQHTAGHCHACGIPSPPAGHVVLRGGPADGQLLQLQDPPPPVVVVLDPAGPGPAWFDVVGPLFAALPQQLAYRGTYSFSTSTRRRIYDYAGR